MSTKTIENEAAALKQTLQVDLSEAYRHDNPNLTPEGLAQKRSELAKAAQQRGGVVLAALRARMTAEATAVSERAAKVRPRVDDPATIQRKWDQARMRLDAGMSLRQVVATADADTLAAITEWAPTWLDVQAHLSQPSGVEGAKPDTARTLAQLHNSIDERLLVIGDDGTRSAIEADREARSAAAVFEQHATHVGRLVAGTASDPMAAAVAALYEGQAVGAGLPADGE